METQGQEPTRHKHRQSEPLFIFDEEYREKIRKEEKNILEWAIFIAIIIHIVLLYMVWPKFGGFKGSTAREYKRPIVFVPLPKKEQPTPEVKKKKREKRKPKPIPDPNPEEPEEIYEWEPEEPDPIEIPEDAIVLFGEPQGPPVSTGPQRGYTNPPKIIPSTKVEPKYPEILRQTRIEGSVLLEVVILKDGTIDPNQITVIRSSHEYFEQEAIKAVKKWRFKPALQNGIPVDVYFYLEVQFTLRKR